MKKEEYPNCLSQGRYSSFAFSVLYAASDVEAASGVLSGAGSGVGSGVASGVGSGVGSGVASGVGSGVGSGVASGVGLGVVSGVVSGVGVGLGVLSGFGVGAGVDGVSGFVLPLLPVELPDPEPPPLCAYFCAGESSSRRV